MICFEEVTHFSAKQFWYLVSRNRSTCGVRPYIQATCNPDADSWVAEFISWRIDQDTRYAIPARSRSQSCDSIEPCRGHGNSLRHGNRSPVVNLLPEYLCKHGEWCR